MNLSSETKVSVSDGGLTVHAASPRALDPSAQLLVNMRRVGVGWERSSHWPRPSQPTGSWNKTSWPVSSKPRHCLCCLIYRKGNAARGGFKPLAQTSTLYPKITDNAPFPYTILIHLPCSSIFTSNAKKYNDDIIWARTSTKNITAQSWNS